jgi:hypothetical protein
MESYKSWKEDKEDDALFHAFTEEEFEGESSLHWLVWACHAHCLGSFSASSNCWLSSFFIVNNHYPFDFL